MLTTTRNRVAALLGAACMSWVLAGCGAEEGRRRAHAPGEGAQESKQEADSKKAFGYAKKTDTAEAYLDVIKRYEGTTGAGEARLELARIRDEQARGALARGDRKKARELIEDALKMADPVVAQKAEGTLRLIDQADARDAAKRVKDALEAGVTVPSCQKAADAVADTLGDRPSPALLRDTRTKTLQALSSCVESAVNATDKPESFAAVRRLVESPTLKRALGEDTWHTHASAFGDRAIAAIGRAVQPAIDKGGWEEAFGVIKKWGEAGAAGPQQVEVASQQARDAITKLLLERGSAALGQAKAAAVLAEVERALKVFEGMNVAAELKTVHAQLGASVECKRLACLVTPGPVLRYNLGATALLPASSSKGEPVDKLPNATKLWVLATGRGMSLVARADPGDIKTWTGILTAATGWVDSAVLHADDTSLWLPTGKALEKERVWLPTGRDDKLYLLGVVESVAGNDVTVKKLSDGQSTSVKRDVLRSGTLQAGLKVLAFCGDQLRATPARFESLVTRQGGVQGAHVVCVGDDGKDREAKDELLGTLRAKPEWLPVRRP